MIRAFEEGHLVRDTEPQVPVDVVRHRIGLGLAFGHLGPPTRLFVLPADHLLDLANGTAADEIDCERRFDVRVSLRAHLRRHTGLCGLRAENARLMDVMCERFLEINMLLGPQGRHRHRRMHVVRRADRHRIHAVTQLRNHLAVITKCRSIPESLLGRRVLQLLPPRRHALRGQRQRLRIHITHAHDAHLRMLQHAHHRVPAHATDTNRGDLKHRVRRLRAQDGRCGNISGSGKGLLEEMTAVHEAV